MGIDRPGFLVPGPMSVFSRLALPGERCEPRHLHQRSTTRHVPVLSRSAKTSFPEARTTSLRSVVLHSGLSPSIGLVRDWTNDACQCVAPGPISDCGLSPPTKLFPEPSGGGCTRRGCRANYAPARFVFVRRSPGPWARACGYHCQKLRGCCLRNVGVADNKMNPEPAAACAAAPHGFRGRPPDRTIRLGGFPVSALDPRDSCRLKSL